MSQKEIKIAIVQENPCVGDIKGNTQLAIDYYEKAKAQQVDIIVYSEMFITGYPAEDLVLRPRFIHSASNAIDALAKLTKDSDTAIIIGGLHYHEDKRYNAAFYIKAGVVENVILKNDLPNYSVFDEKRVFSKGPGLGVITHNGHDIAILLCEEMWNSDLCHQVAQHNPVLTVVLNASPFEQEKHQQRIKHAHQASAIIKTPLVYVNQYGGQDEIVFDGGSFICDGEKILEQGPFFMAYYHVFSCEHKHGNLKLTPSSENALVQPNAIDLVHGALVTGLGDYVTKNRFPGVVIGMSGGVDSALTAALAVDALGAKKVKTIMMPSQYTSKESLIDAEQCSKNLGVDYEILGIDDSYQSIETTLAPFLANTTPDLTEENIQSRIRGLLLMAVSNKHNLMVLTTGNKSEMAVGYATLYGDMCGGYNVLKDVYKTQVYELCRYINRNGEIIPQNIIDKAPSAELRHDQKDADSLPEYDELDAILHLMVEEKYSVKRIVEQGFAEEVVRRVAGFVYRSEYKRRQAPPGVKITKVAFGKDRRYPITNGFEF